MLKIRSTIKNRLAKENMILICTRKNIIEMNNEICETNLYISLKESKTL